MTTRHARAVPYGLPIALALAALALLPGGCSGTQFADVLGTDCGPYQQQYQSELQASGQLAQGVPTGTESFPMALVLNTNAINDLFSRLSNAELPELSESTTVLGQRLGVSVRPSLPLLQVGGEGGCPDCFRANVPFDVGLDLAGFDLPRGSGGIAVQMPIRLVPDGDDRTSLVAQFQSIEVLGLDLSFRNEIAGNIFSAVEPVISTLLTRFLQSRFEDQTIVSLDSWRIGQGQVVLAGRGPFVFPETGTVMIAMQSNLPMGGSSLAAQSTLPPGADIGVVIHPGLLGAMGRRMIYEDVIPQSYDASGNASRNGSVHLTLQGVGSTDDGMLRTTSTLWQTGGLCGAADIAASVAFSASPEGVSFAVSDVSVSNGRGSGQLLQQADDMVGGYLDALLQTLEVTVNYDEILGGSAQEQPAVETFQFNVDGRGVSLFFGMGG